MSPTLQDGNRPIVLASGGTGGHVFPAKALAELLAARGHRVALVTDTRGSAFDDASAGIEVHKIRAGGIAGRGIVPKIKGAAKLLLGWFDARRLMGELRPAVVVGFGGYASVPTVLAAGGRGIPVVLHEQNAVIGRANRMLAKQASAIATCFERVEKIPAGDRRKVVLVGNPVREAVKAVRDMAPAPLTENGPREILVTGGSQGATVFALIEPVSASAVFGAGQTLETVTHRITMRWRDGVASGMRLTRAGRTFEIVTVHDPDETGRYLVCRTREAGA
ncbi:phage head closure protein [Thalassobaculum salexigens]|uniref:phage head closure protein n=1 Tax=Thalassobaculum salexigens TaxID=455360 RepID=UPI00248EA3A6|nr:phage head closure protein [Thalassobaculum salexigens]